MISHVVGTGRPLVAIHGFGFDHRIMLPLETIAGTEDWQRIYLDLPWAAGSRGSDAASTYDVAISVVDGIRDYLGTQRFALIGNSFGGMIARYVAHHMRGQVLGLATLAGVFEPLHSERTLLDRRVLRKDAAVAAIAGKAREDFEEMAVLQTEETVAAFNRYVLPGLLGADKTTIERISINCALPVEPEVQYATPFEAPSLHVFGRQDHVTGYEDGWELREHYPRGTYAVLDAAGHNVHLEQQSLTAALISNWLARIGSVEP